MIFISKVWSPDYPEVFWTVGSRLWWNPMDSCSQLLNFSLSSSAWGLRAYETLSRFEETANQIQIEIQLEWRMKKPTRNVDQRLKSQSGQFEERPQKIWFKDSIQAETDYVTGPREWCDWRWHELWQESVKTAKVSKSTGKYSSLNELKLQSPHTVVPIGLSRQYLVVVWFRSSRVAD